MSMTMSVAATVAGDDLVQPFQIEGPVERGTGQKGAGRAGAAVRGRLVRLGSVVDAIVTRHDYPDAVASLLGEAITLAVILAGALKYEGVFTLQTKGDGPVHLMVADVTSAGAVRGYAQYDAERLQAISAPHAVGSVPRLLGAGYIAFTVDQGEHTDRYQGIVELQGASLAECAHHYFRQSEQLQAGIKTAIARDPASQRWRAGGIMLQRLPAEGLDTFAREAQEDGWRRAMVLMSSSTSAELIDPALAPHDLLFRLFHEDGVRVFAAHGLAARCRCSRERIERILRQLPAEDNAEIVRDPEVRVTCEFCNARYSFARDDLAPGRRSSLHHRGSA
jgi:molecular chaperone Hsp33